MYTLYYSPGTASLAVHWMLIELGVGFDLVAIDFDKREQKSAQYLAVNPSGRVPALVIDGAAHTECAALLMLLAERHPEAGFEVTASDPERADYLQWMFYMANTMQPAFRAWFYPDEPAGPENVEAVQREARRVLEGAWERIDGLLGDGRPHLLGPRMTAADFLAAMLMRWSRNMPRPAGSYPHIATYLQRVRSMPSLKEVHRREGLVDWIHD